MSAPIAVLPVVRGDDGVWEAIIDVVRTGDDVEVRDALDDAKATTSTVRVGDEERTLQVWIDDDGAGVVRYADALPA